MGINTDLYALNIAVYETPSLMCFDETKHSRSSFKGGLVEHTSPTLVAQQSVTKNIEIMVINLVTPKAAAKREPLFNKPGSGGIEERCL